MKLSILVPKLLAQDSTVKKDINRSIIYLLIPIMLLTTLATPSPPQIADRLVTTYRIKFVIFLKFTQAELVLLRHFVSFDSRVKGPMKGFSMWKK